MSLNTLNYSYIRGSYLNDLLFFLKMAENGPLLFDPNARGALAIETDSQNRPVLGYGYDLIANRATAINDLTSVGVALTSVQRQAISSLNESTRGIPAALSQLALPSEAAATQLLSMALASRVGLFDSFMSSNNITLPESRERAALLSMWYQTPNYFRKGGKSTTLTKALVAGNRAEVWFQMRYGSSGSLTHPDPGIVRRRYAESTYFSLYDGGNVDQAQAMQIYQMFTLHRKKMMDYDTRQAAQMAATGGTPGYGIGVPRLTDPDGLGRAENVLLVTLGNKYGVISDISSRGIVATDIYVNPQRLEADVVSSLNFNADLDERSVTANSLLIGGNGNSSLYGGGGNDIIIAGNGDQFLSGGAGSDTLIGGVGADTLDGGTGKGDVFVYTIPAVAGQGGLKSQVQRLANPLISSSLAIASSGVSQPRV